LRARGGRFPGDERVESVKKEGLTQRRGVKSAGKRILRRKKMGRRRRGGEGSRGKKGKQECHWMIIKGGRSSFGSKKKDHERRDKNDREENSFLPGCLRGEPSLLMEGN